MFDINIPACFVISTHSAHEDGDDMTAMGSTWKAISTHSAHEDGDVVKRLGSVHFL